MEWFCVASDPMSNTPENDLNLDLHFLPSWAQKSPDINRYANFTGHEGADRRAPRRDSRDSRGGGGFRPPGGPGAGGGGPRPERRGPAGPGQASGGGPRPSGGDRFGGGPRRNEGGPRPDFRGPRPGGGFNRDRAPEGPPPPPLLELNVALHPDEKGVDSLARQIKMSGRAYPLFEIAQMILKKPERHQAILSVKKKADGTPVQPLFSCALDDSLWLSEAEVIKYILDHHFGTFYQVEKVSVEPPKGTYTFVAQCGISGVILGPPNHHDYQNQLRRLHSERFARMPFEAFKSRVKIVRDEAVVKKWVDDQSFKAEYNCLNVPEPLRLPGREEVEKHFREFHVPNLIRPVVTVTLSHEAVRGLRNQALQRLIRSSYDSQRRFPLQIATLLSQQFASRGLQFFKVNKTVTHVAVARPHFLDFETNVVSDGVRKIVNFINATVGCTRRQLFEALVPGGIPPAATAPVAAPAAPGDAAPAAVPVVEKVVISPELQAFISDLHWLIHQGHVIEFANGVMETAKKPVARPVKTAAPTAPAAAAAAAVPDMPTPGEADSPLAGEATTSSLIATSAPVAESDASSEAPAPSAS